MFENSSGSSGKPSFFSAHSASWWTGVLGPAGAANNCCRSSCSCGPGPAARLAWMPQPAARGVLRDARQLLLQKGRGALERFDARARRDGGRAGGSERALWRVTLRRSPTFHEVSIPPGARIENLTRRALAHVPVEREAFRVLGVRAYRDRRTNRSWPRSPPRMYWRCTMATPLGPSAGTSSTTVTRESVALMPGFSMPMVRPSPFTSRTVAWQRRPFRSSDRDGKAVRRAKKDEQGSHEHGHQRREPDIERQPTEHA